MGGFGSGRWHEHDKMAVVEDCTVLSLAEFIKRGLLRTPARFVWSDARAENPRHLQYHRDPSGLKVHLRFTLRSGYKARQVVQEVPLTSTLSPIGGIRHWFACPMVNDGRPCRRRVDKLYLPPGGTHFGCRQCHRLTYRSCQESHDLDCLARGLGMTAEEQKQVVRFFERRRGRIPALGSGL